MERAQTWRTTQQELVPLTFEAVKWDDALDAAQITRTELVCVVRSSVPFGMSKICAALPADRMKADALLREVPEDEDEEEDEEKRGEDEDEEADDEGEGYSE